MAIKKKKSSILTLPMLLVSVPITLLSIIFSFVAPRNIYIGNIESSKEQLNNICLVANLECEDHGFTYALRNEINKINEATGIEFTIFKGSDQFMTTTTWGNSHSGDYIADAETVAKALSTKENYFVANVLFEEHSFCSYYMPIMDGDDAIGVIFAAKNIDEVNAQMRKMIAIILTGSWSTFFYLLAPLHW